MGYHGSHLLPGGFCRFDSIPLRRLPVVARGQRRGKRLTPNGCRAIDVPVKGLDLQENAVHSTPVELPWMRSSMSQIRPLASACWCLLVWLAALPTQADDAAPASSPTTPRRAAPPQKRKAPTKDRTPVRQRPTARKAHANGQPRSGQPPDGQPRNARPRSGQPPDARLRNGQPPGARLPASRRAGDLQTGGRWTNDPQTGGLLNGGLQRDDPWSDSPWSGGAM